MAAMVGPVRLRGFLGPPGWLCGVQKTARKPGSQHRRGVCVCLQHLNTCSAGRKLGTCLLGPVTVLAAQIGVVFIALQQLDSRAGHCRGAGPGLGPHVCVKRNLCDFLPLLC